MELKKLLRVFFLNVWNVWNVLNMSHRNGAFVFQVTGFLKQVMGSADPGVWLSHSKMVGCHSLYGWNFDF